MFKVSNLQVSADNKKILKGVNFEIAPGQVVALMGKNGSGKSTLAQTVMGNPFYMIDSGEIYFDGQNINDLNPQEKANLGIFLSFQYPSEVSGAGVLSYLRMIYNKRHNLKTSPVVFRKLLEEKMQNLGINKDFINRYLNDGFSGGEKKRMEILQMVLLEPKLAILDELDSGLDVDGIKTVAEAVNTLVQKNKMAVLIITHYTRVLEFIHPDQVHVMQDGIIVRSGDSDLAHKLEEEGFAQFEDNVSL